jgi:hypothetical protein
MFGFCLLSLERSKSDAEFGEVIGCPADGLLGLGDRNDLDCDIMDVKLSSAMDTPKLIFYSVRVHKIFLKD